MPLPSIGIGGPFSIRKAIVSNHESGSTGTVSSQPTSSPEQSRAWVMENGELRDVPLKLGLDDDTNSEILEGALKPGDAVVVGGQSGSGSPSSSASRPRLFGF